MAYGKEQLRSDSGLQGKATCALIMQCWTRRDPPDSWCVADQLWGVAKQGVGTLHFLAVQPDTYRCSAGLP
jgi:hypothetical protein